MARFSGRSQQQGSQALRWVLAAVLSATLIGSAGGQIQPRPEQCARVTIGCIDDVVNAAYDICQAAADCTLPGLDQLSCAGDLTDMMSYWFNLGQKISTLTLVCGQVDNSCAGNILQSLGDMSDTSNNLVAAAQDCTTDSWLCAYDIVSAVDTIDFFVGDIIYALQSCNNGKITPVDFPLFVADSEFPAFQRGDGPSDGGYYERRLKEVPTGSADAADSEPNAVTSAAAEVAQARANATVKESQWEDVYSEIQAEFQQLRALIEKKKAAMAGAEAGKAEARKAAWQSLVERVRSQKNGTTSAGSPAPRGHGNLTDVPARLKAAAAAAAAAAARMPRLPAQAAKEEIHV